MENAKRKSGITLMLGIMAFNILSAMYAVGLYMALEKEWLTSERTAEILGGLLGLNVFVVGVATVASVVLWIQEPAPNGKLAAISILFGLVYLGIAGYFILLGLEG
jgi:hypothetical protein